VLRGLVCGLVFAGVVLAVSGVQAQPAAPPVEDVTVTGTKSRQVIERFVKSLAMPTRLTGKIARWEDGVCPIADGIPAAFGKFLRRHIKDVAASVGAPVNSHQSCEPNIQIVFSKNPQALLDDIHKIAPDLLGYYDNDDQRTRATRIVRPIQAWYTSQTVDLRGHAHVDTSHSGGLMLSFSPTMPPIFIPHAIAGNVTGSRLNDGIRASFYQVLIVADPDALKNYEMGALGDYIAMLALSQLDSLDSCQQLPSIVNMLAKNCASKTEALTENDTAYLRGLYSSSPDSNLNLQEGAIAYQMGQALLGR
jgi:hypothetical protein